MRVSALADPVVQDIAPVYETQIYQLQDYVAHDLEAPQLEVFYLLWAFYQFAMAGAEDYTIPNPYETQDGVLNWLKGIGVDAYNTLIALAPDTVRLPDGSLMYTDSLKRALSADIEAAMGLALKASEYEDTQDLLDDIDEVDYYFIPWNSKMQYGLNTMYQTYGGMYNWQFNEVPFTSNKVWQTATIPATSNYWTYLNNLPLPHVRYNPNWSTSWANGYVGGSFFQVYKNMFLNTTNGRVYLVNDSGEAYNSSNVSFSEVYYNGNGNYRNNYTAFHTYQLYPTSNTFVESVRAIYNASYFFTDSFDLFLEDFVEHVYAGDSWATRNEIFNVTSHNLETQNQPYYVSVPDNDNYWLDIKGILTDILNNTDLMDVFINNIYTPDGVLVHDTDLIRVSLQILQEYQEQNPPIPVNLNDIEELTDNTYLERLKEHARNFGDTFAAYVAFWHNADHDLVYTIFGASIMVLIGAFIGKWGHS